MWTLRRLSWYAARYAISLPLDVGSLVEKLLENDAANDVDAFVAEAARLTSSI